MNPPPSSSACSLPPTASHLLHVNWSSRSSSSPSPPFIAMDASAVTTIGSGSSNGLSSASGKEDDYVDDDLFGSAAWRQHKRRGSTKKGHGHSPGQGRPEGEGPKVKDRLTKRWSLAQTVEQRARAVQCQVLAARLKLDTALISVLAFFTARGERNSKNAGGAVPTASSSLANYPEAGSYELTSEALVQQTRLLCGNYIYQRLSSKGLMNKRVHVAPHHSILADELCSACQELERLHPRIYNDVSRRISMTMTSAQLVRRALTTVLDGIFGSGVTWAKVVSMVAIAAAFAEECVVQGHPNFVEDVVMSVGHFATLNLSGWLAKQGGWGAFPMSRPAVMTAPVTSSPSVTLAVVVLIVSLLVFVFSKTVFDVS